MILVHLSNPVVHASKWAPGFLSAEAHCVPMSIGDPTAVDLLSLLARVLVGGFGGILTAVSLRSWFRYREGRFLLITGALGLFALEGALLAYDALTPGDTLALVDGLVLVALAQLLLLYLAIVRR